MNKKTFLLLLFTVFIFAVSITVGCSDNSQQKQTTAQSSMGNMETAHGDSATYIYGAPDASEIRPGEKLEFGKVYTDTLEYIDYNDQGDDFVISVRKNGNVHGLIANSLYGDGTFDDLKLNPHDSIEIRWKIDSMRPAGDQTTLWFTEFAENLRKVGLPSSKESLLYITEYTVYNNGQVITDDAVPDTNNAVETIWNDIHADSRISIGVTEDDIIGLYGNLEPDRQWLCISFPKYGKSEDENRPKVQMHNTTGSYHEDWLGEPYTSLASVEKNGCRHFDIAFREYRLTDFQFLQQSIVEDVEILKKINRRISDEIKSGKISSYRNPADTMILQALNRIFIGSREIFVANYSTMEGRTFVYILENDAIKSLDRMNSFYSEVYFFKLKEDIHMLHIRDAYASHSVRITKINPDASAKDEVIFNFSKSTD